MRSPFDFSGFFRLVIILSFMTSTCCAAGQTSLSFESLGIETWEDGIKTEHIQQWNLSCRFGSSIKECWLDQTVFKDCLPIPGEKQSMVFKKSFSTSKSNLIIQDYDITNGRIDFKIDYKSEPSNCILLFEINNTEFFRKVKALDCKMIHKGLDGSIQTIDEKLIQKVNVLETKMWFFCAWEK